MAGQKENSRVKMGWIVAITSVVIVGFMLFVTWVSPGGGRWPARQGTPESGPNNLKTVKLRQAVMKQWEDLFEEESKELIVHAVIGKWRDGNEGRKELLGMKYGEWIEGYGVKDDTLPMRMRFERSVEHLLDELTLTAMTYDNEFSENSLAFLDHVIVDHGYELNGWLRVDHKKLDKKSNAPILVKQVLQDGNVMRITVKLYFDFIIQDFEVAERQEIDERMDVDEETKKDWGVEHEVVFDVHADDGELWGNSKSILVAE
ncbi:hypothetical protein JD969_08585 [Planctomycetota bacterium]|nr:hypothetical protein JD969_08585 [Planctomycetota bacterium]